MEVIKSLVLVSLLFSSIGYASCPEPVTVIKMGETAVCDGFLFSDEAERKAAKARDDVKYYELITPNLEKKIELEQDRNAILEERLNIYLNQSHELAKRNAKIENDNFYKNVGLFFLGAITMYGAYQVAK